MGFALPVGDVVEEPQPVPEILSPQWLAYEVTIVRGRDPDAPRAGRGHGDPLTRPSAVRPAS